MTPSDLKSARHALGLSANRFAQILQVGSGRTVQRWEAGDREIPGPVVVLVDVLLNVQAARDHVGLKPASAARAARG